MQLKKCKSFKIQVLSFCDSYIKLFTFAFELKVSIFLF